MANDFVPCEEVVPISEANNTLNRKSIICREFVPISEGPYLGGSTVYVCMYVRQ